MGVVVERAGAVATIRIEHGPVNALDLELCEALEGSITELVTDAEVDAIVLTGTGRAFCAGVDLQRILADDDGDDTLAFLDALSRCFLAVYRAAVPTVAAVNGHAIAGGCVLASACDRVLAADDDTILIGLTELAVGVPFPTAAIEIVRGRVGTGLAGLVYEAHNQPPQLARELGLVDHLVPAGELQDRARASAQALAGVPAETFRLAKEQLHRPVEDAIAARAPRWDPRVDTVWTSGHARVAIEGFLARLRG